MKSRVLYLESQFDLSALAEACFSLTPKVFLLHKPEGLWQLYLDIDPTLKVFGGEEEIFLKFQRLLAAFGFSEPWVCCDRLEWARSLLSGGKGVCSFGKSPEILKTLPLTSLAFCGSPTEGEESVEQKRQLVIFLQRLGLCTIGDFAALPPEAVLRRFGKLGADLLAWVRGERECVLAVFCPEEKIKEFFQVDVVEDVQSLEALLFYLRLLLVRIQSRLQGRLIAAKKLQLFFFLDSGVVLERALQLSQPTQESNALHRLLKEFLSSLQWDAPLLKVEIEVREAVPYLPGQGQLFDDKETKFEELAQFVSRLRLRLGESAVGYAQFAGSYLPERSFQVVWPPPLEAAKEVLPKRDFSHRPLFLFFPPKPCPPPHAASVFPSETIESEWWEGQGKRKYFIFQTPCGEKQWLFFDETQTQWFLHGVFE